MTTTENTRPLDWSVPRGLHDDASIGSLSCVLGSGNEYSVNLGFDIAWGNRAGDRVSAGSDTTAEILTWLAESDQMLRLPPGREPLAQRLREFARQEITWEELDLWCFAVEHTAALSSEQILTDPELILLREVLGWIDTWEEAAARPDAARLNEFAHILLTEKDAARCLARLEQTLERT